MASPTFVVHHSYDAEKEDELTLAVGDLITVSDMSDPGWWVGEKVKDGKAGWFPSNFVDPYEETAPSADVPAVTTAPAQGGGDAPPAAITTTTSTDVAESTSPAPKHEGPILARVEYDYEAKESGELSLEVGRVVTILEQSDPAWWTGDLNGKIGTFPSNYVKLIENKDESSEASGEKPTKFRLAAFGVKQGGLGSLFAGGVVPGLKKTGGLKKLSGDGALPGSTSKRSSVDEPRSPMVASAPKISPPLAEEVIAPMINPSPVRHAPAAPVPAAPTSAPAPVEVVASPEPRIPSRAKKPKAKQIRALVIYEYTAQEDDEITLAKGSTVVVTDKMGDEGWWSGRNEQGEAGNFPSDFVQEIKEEVESPMVISAAIASAREDAPRSPEAGRHSAPLPAPPAATPVPEPVVPAVAQEPLRTDLARTKTNETAPLAAPPAYPRSSRPPSMVASPTHSSASLLEGRPVNDGPPLPGSPPPKRMSIVSRSNSHDTPSSPRLASVAVFPNATESVASPTLSNASPGDLSRSSTHRRPHKPIPEAPVQETEEEHQETVAHTETTDSAPNSNRSSYILPTPVSRTRPLPPLARPPSIHQASSENRRSVVIPPTTQLPVVPVEFEAPVHEEAEGESEAAVIPAPSPALAHVEPDVVNEESVKDKEEEVVQSEVHSEPAQEETAVADAEVELEVATEEVVEEKEPEKLKLPEVTGSGPVLSHASRPRPAKGRKPPSAPVPNSETSFASQLEAEVKAAPIVEEKKPEPAPAVERAAPPPKPVKPIFSKFPTPFAGALPVNVALRPTGRRTQSGQDGPQSPGGSDSSSPASGAATAAPAPAVPSGGVKSLSSRFGQFQGVPASGGNSAQLELEMAKLKRFMNEELDKVKRDLAEERENRIKLQEEVDALKARLA